MLQTRFMPCLLVENGRLVKTVKFKNASYVGDPVNAIKIYNDKEVDELIIVDITATKEARDPNFELIKEIADECFMPVCYGGGISSIEQMKALFSLGIEKVALNSHAMNNKNLINNAANRFGSQSIVLSIDVKKDVFDKHIVYTHGGTKKTKYNSVEYAKYVEDAGAGEILLNSIDRDGTWDGFDITMIKKVTDAVNIPVIAIGGAGNTLHISDAVHNGGASAVALGSMAVYQKKGMGVLIRFPKRSDIIVDEYAF
jgi:imidazole glycerol-phosphate synthase subunit HisF